MTPLDLHPLIVGVLAIQGDFEAHGKLLRALDVARDASLRGRRLEVRAVRKVQDLDGISALILPGGESTTISKGLAREALVKPIQEFAAAGHPLLGTCAGAILLCHNSENHPVETLGLLDAVALRNAYGTQVDSFAQTVDDGCAPGFEAMRCVFIRAPKFASLGPGVEVLARVDGQPVFVREKNLFATTFHPELTDDLRVHASLVAAVLH